MRPLQVAASERTPVHDTTHTPRADEPPPPRLLVASNELPWALESSGAHSPWQLRTTYGGLVSGLRPVLESRGGVWLGATGAASDGRPSGGVLIERDAPYSLRAIELDEAEIRDYERGFSNQVLWPMFHGLPDHSLIEADYWPVYGRVNRKFARELAELHREGDLVWVQDYPLLLVGRELRALGITAGVAFFLHTPFPPPELFFRIPWAEELLDALAAYDLVGFQTERHVANFLACIRRLDPDPELGAGHPVMTLGARFDGGALRRYRVGAFPIGVDFYDIARAAGEAEVTERVRALRRSLGERKLLLGVDRLDYTKGVRHKLKAFAALLDHHPEWQGKVVLAQVVIPSREGIPAYDQLKLDIEGLVGEINGRFSKPGWIPVLYRYRPLEARELLVHYRLADAMAVTPLEDGMNLVSKEYCAANVEQSGALVLSRFAGAATQLADGALMVNPWDELGLAEAFHRALTLEPEERRQRMERLRATVRNEDVFHWAGGFLKAALATLPGDGARPATPLAH
jgi:trehalose 6-phosphate synthase/phosphatase